jgi:MFS family permease
MAAQSNATNVAGNGDSSYPSSFAAWYSVAVLMLMYVFSFIDRTTISLLVEPMKRDLHISDTQIGMLQGLAFALLYTFLGLPIARLSDRHSRRAIIAAGVFIWSIMAALCGLARTATQLFMARIGVGVGEAALSPAAYSIITDSFPRSKLGGAFGVYNIGITIGAGTAFLVGGIVVAAVSHAIPCRC